MSFLNGLGDKILGVLNDKIPNVENKMEIKNALVENVGDLYIKMIETKAEVVKLEAGGNSLQRNWRPVIMLAFGFIVMYSKFIAPAFGLPNTELEPDFWSLLNLGIGGYVVGRSGEKIVSSIVQNIDMPFLKRKDRKAE